MQLEHLNSWAFFSLNCVFISFVQPHQDKLIPGRRAVRCHLICSELKPVRLWIITRL